MFSITSSASSQKFFFYISSFLFRILLVFKVLAVKIVEHTRFCLVMGVSAHK